MKGLLLLERIVPQIPDSAVLQRPELNGPMQDVATLQGDYAFACTFYSIEPTEQLLSERKSTSPQAAAYANLLNICSRCVAISDSHASDKTATQALDRTLSLLSRVLARTEHQQCPLDVPWRPANWLDIIMGSSASNVTSHVALLVLPSTDSRTGNII